MLTAFVFWVLANQQPNWIINAVAGPASYDAGEVTVKGSGFATYALPKNLGDNWRISFSVRRTPGVAGTQQYVSVGNVESLVRMAFTQGNTCYAHMYRRDHSVHIPAGGTWHTAELYNVRGMMTLRWDGKVQATLQTPSQPTAITVGSSGGSSRAIRVELRDLRVDLTDRSLASVPLNVPVPVEMATTLKPAPKLLFENSVTLPAVALDDADLELTAYENLVTAPPLVEIRLIPRRMPPGFVVADAGIVVNGVLAVDQKIADPDLSLPWGSFDLSRSSPATYNASYQVADENGRQFSLVQAHVYADAAVEYGVRAATTGDNVVLKTSLPVANLFLFNRGEFLGRLSLANGVATFAQDLLPVGSNQWSAVATNDRGYIWGPIPVTVSAASRVRFSAHVYGSDVPNYQLLVFGASPSGTCPGNKMNLFLNGSLIESVPVASAQRSLLVPSSDFPALLQAQLVADDGKTIDGGALSVALPK